MKRIIALFGLLSVITLSSIINSCGKLGGATCGRKDRFSDYKYHANQISGTLRAVIGSDEEDIRTHSYTYNELIFKIGFSGQHYSCISPTFDLFPSAYACSPPEPYSDEKITDIIIISNEDYDETHPAGTDLKDLFEVQSSNGNRSTVSEYLQKQPKIEYIEFKLAKAPEEKKTHTFTITYHYAGKLMQELSYQFEPVQIRVL